MNILLTGASGFIGSRLAQALSETTSGIKLRALVRKTSSLSRLNGIKNIEYVTGDLNDILSLRRCVCGIDMVYHAAGLLGSPLENTKQYYIVNTQGTDNLVKACLKAGSIKHFVHISTAGVHGPGAIKADEDFPFCPSNLYEQSKAQAENIVSEYLRRMKFPATIIRPEFVYGPGDTHVLGLFKAIKKSMFLFIDNGQSLLHPTFIDDLIHVLCACCGNKASIGRTYLIAGERAVTVKDLANMIACCLNANKIKMSIPRHTAYLTAYFFEFIGRCFGIDPLLTRQRVDFFTQSRSYKTSKAETELGLKPLALQEGISQTAKWYKEKGYL